MKLIALAAAALALTGCMSVPVTKTAYNDEACLRASVRSSTIKPPVTAADRAPLGAKCKSMSASWAGAGQQAMSNLTGEGMPYQSHH